MLGAAVLVLGFAEPQHPRVSATALLSGSQPPTMAQRRARFLVRCRRIPGWSVRHAADVLSVENATDGVTTSRWACWISCLDGWNALCAIISTPEHPMFAIVGAITIFPSCTSRPAVAPAVNAESASQAGCWLIRENAPPELLTDESWQPLSAAFTTKRRSSRFIDVRNRGSADVCASAISCSVESWLSSGRCRLSVHV
jgi:hypothetical protein